MKRILVVVITCFLAVSSSLQAGVISGQAQDFTLKSLDGKNLRLSEFRGQVVLLNFWASWCGPCRQEMPVLNELHKKYQALGFTVLGINLDEDNRKALSYLKDISVDFPVLLDPENSVSKAYEVDTMPSTFMIDRDGKLRYLHRAYKPGDESKYKTMIKQLIRE